jgi:DNA-directed RNA polymerase subunit beta'
MIDIALKTGVAGDLTRRLVESSQGISIITDDCGSKLGLKFSRDLSKNSLQSRSHGRYLLEDVLDENGNIILGKDTLILDKESKVIEKQNIEHLEVRSPITCRLADGICQKCYGTDLSNPEKLVKIGTAVGIIAAQSLGEPGTQLTMNTFHTGGIAGDEDITQGLPKVKQIFDNIKPKKEEKAVLSRYPGKIIKVADSEVHQLTEEQEQPLVIYEIGKNRSIKVNEGDEVKIGEKLTNGRVDLEEFLEITGRDITQEFIKEEIRKVYFFQGIEINEKHIEIFSKRMLSKVLVTDGGDSEYLSGDVESYQFVMKENERLVSEGKKKISYQNMISSLKDLASQPSSFLAGISFQNTLKSLVNYSLYQPIDYLKGSKESLIAGQLIPVGVGLTEREKYMNNKKLK